MSNFMTGVVIARLYGPAEFGLYALTMMIWLAVVGFHRALITEPVIISSGAGAKPRTMVADGFSAEVLVGGAVSVLVATAGGVATAAGFRLGILMLALSPWLVALLVQDYWRAMSFRESKPQFALVSDLLFAAVQGLMLITFLILGWQGSVSVVTAWCVGATAGALLGFRWFPVALSIRRGWRLLHRLWPLSRWMAADFFTSLAADQTYLFVLALLLSKTDYGGFRAAYSLMGPIMVIALAAGNIGLPAAVRRIDPYDSTALRFFARRLTRSMIIIVALYGGVVALGGSFVLRAVYGAQFANFAPLAALIALAYVIAAVVFGQGVVLKAAGHVRPLWRVRLVVAAASLVSVTVLVHWLGTAGAGWAGVTTAALYCGGVYLVYRAALLHPVGRMTRGWDRPAAAALGD